MEAFGPLGILVNNAGGVHLAPMEELTGHRRCHPSAGPGTGSRGDHGGQHPTRPETTGGNPSEGDFAGLVTGPTPAGRGRYALPDELTGLSVHLAGFESSYVTGSTINIDVGCTV
ncbi:hypothetical protein AB0D91_45005 [Streptomyces canus]|uniref:hypothetical protein n=1 Tax=Streptomyces canus TaxID=58343 RepID=UPI0033D8C2B9